MSGTATHRPILVTGSHRSGTTWFGLCLGKAAGVHLHWEPFSISYRPSLMHPPAPCWFYQMNKGNPAAARYEAGLRRLIDMRYSVRTRLGQIRHPRDFSHLLRDWWVLRRERPNTQRVILKDPIALFSAPWIEDTFAADIVVAVRRPAAFCDSLLRDRWSFPFRDLVAQPKLVEAHFQNLWPEIEAQAAKPHSLLDQSILLYRILYQYVREQVQSGRNSWQVVLHETFAENPLEHFPPLYKAVGLEWTSEIAASFKAEARVNTLKWKGNLSQDDISRIHEKTADLETYFYGNVV